MFHKIRSSSETYRGLKQDKTFRDEHKLKSKESNLENLQTNICSSYIIASQMHYQ